MKAKLLTLDALDHVAGGRGTFGDPGPQDRPVCTPSDPYGKNSFVDGKTGEVFQGPTFSAPGSDPSEFYNTPPGQTSTPPSATDSSDDAGGTDGGGTDGGGTDGGGDGGGAGDGGTGDGGCIDGGDGGGGDGGGDGGDGGGGDGGGDGGDGG